MPTDNKSEVVIFKTADEKISVDVRFEGETVWLTQAQLVELYGSSKANVSEHIKHIFEEEELTKEATVRKFRTVQTEGNRNVEREVEYYNLDMIISLGYRIKSKIATQFRQWATKAQGKSAIKRLWKKLNLNIENIRLRHSHLLKRRILTA